MPHSCRPKRLPLLYRLDHSWSSKSVYGQDVLPQNFGLLEILLASRHGSLIMVGLVGKLWVGSSGG